MTGNDFPGELRDGMRSGRSIRISRCVSAVEVDDPALPTSCGPVPHPARPMSSIDPAPISSLFRISSDCCNEPSGIDAWARGARARARASASRRAMPASTPHPTIRRSTRACLFGPDADLEVTPGGSRCESLPGPARPARSRTAFERARSKARPDSRCWRPAYDLYGPVLAELQVRVLALGFRMTAVGTGVGMTLHHDHVHARAGFLCPDYKELRASTGICFRRSLCPAGLSTNSPSRSSSSRSGTTTRIA